jgi:hypothetical protein
LQPSKCSQAKPQSVLKYKPKKHLLKQNTSGLATHKAHTQTPEGLLSGTSKRFKIQPEKTSTETKHLKVFQKN